MKGIRIKAPKDARRKHAPTQTGTPLVELVEAVLTQAVRARASDIHFEPFEHELKIRYRVDGALHEMAPAPAFLGKTIATRLKVLARLDIAEQRAPQDGRFSFTAEGRTVDLRLSTLPTQWGESAVLRVLDQTAVALDPEALGLPIAVREQLEKWTQRPHGLVVVTGPTGSGKTTTLYAYLQTLNRPGAKIVTVEDPVEYELPGAVQVQVEEAIGLGFAQALRSLLRHDPDVLMVGEMRDAETTQMAVQAALTGHLVLTTLHTHDGAGAIARLLDLGIEPYLLCATLTGVVVQRLVRRICPSCRHAFAPSPELLKEFGFDAPGMPAVHFHKGIGCDDCHGTGYRGRLPLVELWPITPALHALIHERAPAVELRRAAQACGFDSLRSSGRQRVLAGETTAEEVLGAVA